MRPKNTKTDSKYMEYALRKQNVKKISKIGEEKTYKNFSCQILNGSKAQIEIGFIPLWVLDL